MKEFVPLRILSVNPSSVGASSYILLLEADNTQALRFPIVIGSQEAQSISVYLEKIQPSRPLTHDLCVNLLSHSNVSILKVLITDFKDGIFYANLEIEKDGEVTQVDARPSDSIALAIRLDIPILISEKLLHDICIPEDELLDELEEEYDLIEKIPSKRSKVELESLLDKALQEENYEEAAKLRDEIEKL
ncbi:bifunctional nuclease family protein [Aquirufa sp. HETE-83D]|uniref:Bifunctional nuclease family protein n=1 Tax=Aquirufa esocilacus TaxID=3096513 RepID=A0ABW6DJR2_9BACT